MASPSFHALVLDLTLLASTPMHTKWIKCVQFAVLRALVYVLCLHMYRLLPSMPAIRVHLLLLEPGDE